jgi:hypothetical protein
MKPPESHPLSFTNLNDGKGIYPNDMPYVFAIRLHKEVANKVIASVNGRSSYTVFFTPSDQPARHCNAAVMFTATELSARARTYTNTTTEILNEKKKRRTIAIASSTELV